MKLFWKLFKVVGMVLVLALIFHDTAARWALTFFLQWSIGAPVSVQAAHVKLKEAEIEWEGILIRQPASFGGDVMADVPYLFLDFEFQSSASNPLRLKTAEVFIQRLRMVQNSEGRLNVLTPALMRAFSSNSKSNFLSFGLGQMILTLREASFENQRLGTRKTVDVRLKRRVYPHVKGGVSGVVFIPFYEALRALQVEGWSDYLRRAPSAPSFLEALQQWGKERLLR